MINEEFEGFTPNTIDFLWALRMNNSKQWMDENRNWYYDALKKPVAAFADAFEKAFDAHNQDLNLVASVSRINRDIRFSKDKSPYKAKAWIVLKPAGTATQWKTRPTFFFELYPEGYCYGCGIYSGTASYMAAVRKKIDADTVSMERLAADLKKQSYFKLETEPYKRKMGTEKSSDVMPWYQAKWFSMIAEHPLEERFYGKNLPNQVAEELSVLLPLYRYFWINP